MFRNYKSSACFSITVATLTLAAPLDSTNYFCGGLAGRAPTTTGLGAPIYVPVQAIVRAAYISWEEGTAGTDETIQMFLRKNDTTDYAVQNIGSASASKVFINNNMAIDCLAGDILEVKFITPAWATNPINVRIGGQIFLLL